MNVENNTPVPPAEGGEAKQEEVVLPKIKVASGDEVTLHPEEIAILITFDTRTGQPAVYDVQNCPLRAFSKMLLNEALDLYNVIKISSNTAKTIADMEEKKKKGLFGLGSK